MIFLDVGANEGQTLEELTELDGDRNPRYPFTAIHSFEPMPDQFSELRARFGHLPHVHLHPFGLHDHTAVENLYGTNELTEASIWAGKNDVDPAYVTRCLFFSASEFLATLPDDVIVVKLNCEGAEIPIVADLAWSGQINRIAALMIDWDIRKVPEERDREHRIKELMAARGFDRWAPAEDVMSGDTHGHRINHWLRTTGLIEYEKEGSPKCP